MMKGKMMTLMVSLVVVVLVLVLVLVVMMMVLVGVLVWVLVVVVLLLVLVCAGDVLVVVAIMIIPCTCRSHNSSFYIEYQQPMRVIKEMKERLMKAKKSVDDVVSFYLQGSEEADLYTFNNLVYTLCDLRKESMKSMLHVLKQCNPESYQQCLSRETLNLKNIEAWFWEKPRSLPPSLPRQQQNTTTETIPSPPKIMMNLPEKRETETNEFWKPILEGKTQSSIPRKTEREECNPQILLRDNHAKTNFPRNFEKELLQGEEEGKESKSLVLTSWPASVSYSKGIVSREEEEKRKHDVLMSWPPLMSYSKGIVSTMCYLVPPLPLLLEEIDVLKMSFGFYDATNVFVLRISDFRTKLIEILDRTNNTLEHEKRVLLNVLK
eukprot:TRINITY_DN10315_c0_g3_i1.p1 TRINITY_DN10315_c0_g3~~TRINITY_DN10315_c0_g3_i1.p1  ORF type:complete len:379 (+),score=109.58 TRINITY_DN10315_c0_g3_i1:2-1138(+)